MFPHLFSHVCNWHAPEGLVLMPISPVNPFPRRPVVLLVEDHADSREMYTTVLEFAGMDVRIADDASSAFDLAVTARPDVIVTDFTLRGPDDGSALCRQLQADARTTDIPVLVVTGSTRPADFDALTRAGCADIRTKPYLPEALVSDVERLVAVARPRRATQAS
jgi:CheY-like chemotaxis protein